jgi:NADPH:quinone reductase-like Zn-dependent oxidoreductase
MKAMYLHEPSGPGSLTWGELPSPAAPAAGQVRVRVHATAVTPTEFDWFPTFHTPSGAPRAFPIVPGHELSGVIEAVGPEVDGLQVGDAVFGCNDWFGDGAFAELTLAPAVALAPKPRSLTHAQAAVVPISALTAWQALVGRGAVRAGQRVLIHGAAGGVGVFAVQLAHALGAHVIATASSGNLDFVRGLGADVVIDYRTTRFEDVARDVDLVFDAVGGDTLARSWSVLRAGGRLVTIAASSAGATDPREKEAFLLVEPLRADLVEIARRIDAGGLRVFVEAEYPLADARAAFARAQQGRMRGKIALILAP